MSAIRTFLELPGERIEIWFYKVQGVEVFNDEKVVDHS